MRRDARKRREKRRWMRAGHGGPARGGAEETTGIAIRGSRGGKRYAEAADAARIPQLTGANALIIARF